MKKQVIIALTSIVCVHIAQAQTSPSIEWQRPLGGSMKDEAYDVRPTTDGGYVVAGYASSNDSDVTGNHGSQDAWVVKLNDVGSITWQKTLGGSDNEIAYAIQPTTVGGYVVAGVTTSNDGDVTGNHGSYDAWVVKVDAIGNIIWQKALGGSGSDHALALQRTTENGYVLAGKTTSEDGDVTGNHGTNDVWVVKLNDMGDIIWQKALGGSSSDIAYAVQQTTDGGYVVAGRVLSNDGDVTGNHGAFDAWVVKLDAMGNMTWQKTLGGSESDLAYAVQQTTDGGYVVAGTTLSNDGDVTWSNGDPGDVWVVKLDAAGNISWQKALGGTDLDRAYAVQQTTDGGFVVVGEARSNDGDVTGNHGDSDIWAVKLDAMGNITWQKSLGGSGLDIGNAVQQTSDGGYVMAGRTESNDGDVSGYNGNKDGWVVKLDGVIANGLEEQAMVSLHVAPNPAQGLIRISSNRQVQGVQVTLTDALGREVLREGMKGTSTSMDLTHQPRGPYLLTMRSTEGVASQRLILE